MDTFPLYDTVVDTIVRRQKKKRKKPFTLPLFKKDLSSVEKRNLIETVKEELSQKSLEFVYLLIREDRRRNPTDEEEGISYGGTQLKKGLKFDFETFPIRLKRILQMFVEMDTEAGHQSDVMERETFKIADILSSDED